MAIGLAAALACSEVVEAPRATPERWTVHRRLVDLLHPATPAGLLPSAERGGDRRLTLRAALARHWLAVQYAPALREVLRSPLPEALADVPRLEARLQAMADGEPETHSLPAVEPAPDRRGVSIAVPPALLGREAVLELRPARGHAPEGEAIESPVLEIPAAARLRFALGAPQATHAQFRVEACDAGGCRDLFAESLGQLAGWQERSVHLTGWAGRSVRLRFTTGEREHPDAVWANPTIEVPAEAGTGPSLLLVSLDTLSARHMGTYGSERDTSPFLDEHFGRHGTVVERFVASEVHTGPSHMSLFTSLVPSTHGVRAGTFRRLPLGVDTLAGRLRAAGMTTGAVTENAAIFVGGGFERGFEEYLEIRSEGRRAGAIERSFAAARDWLDRHGDRRFFLFLHTYQPHWPYESPAAYQALFRDGGAPTPERLPESRSPRRYDRGVRFVDDSLQSLLGSLEEHGLLASTLVVVTSDHGEAFLEHGQVGHGAQLYAEATHVPLLMAGPGVPSDTRLPGRVAQIDLAPTLLELLDAPPLSDGMGRSFVARLQGDAGTDEGRPAFSEAWYRSGRAISPTGRPYAVPHAAPTRAIEWRGHKLIRRRDEPERDEHYLLEPDPGERHDVAPHQLPMLAELRRRLDAHLRDAEAARDALLRRERALLRGADLARDVTPDAAQLERLRALGYADLDYDPQAPNPQAPAEQSRDE